MRSLMLIAVLALLTAVVSAARQIIVGPGPTFSPEQVTVKVGEAVDFVWQGTVPHDVVEGRDCSPRQGGFRTDLRAEGANYSLMFTQTGERYYYCTPHCAGGMVGVINVVA
ncbi:Cupredoxin [Ramicandelaber brevisporus]|nr:Cupredoxin [Ramicandelaber brevisporus]KAI8872843.1 Cupredoxin [Ramicandelaber brevisporus]